MTELTVDTVDALVAVDSIVRRIGPALHTFAVAMCVEAGEPTDDAGALVIEALARVLEQHGLDRALAERAAFDRVASVLLSNND